MVDNTNVVVASGSGADAVIAPEMEAFGQIFGFEFVAHAIGDANRSARVERPFYYVERNFLPGRRFSSWDDLNQQARAWCEQVANQKPKRALGMSPEAAYVLEKPALLPLPALSAPGLSGLHPHRRCGGYAYLDTNRYSVPERLIGKKVEVYKYPQAGEGPVSSPGGGRTPPAGGQAPWAKHAEGTPPTQKASSLSGAFL